MDKYNAFSEEYDEIELPAIERSTISELSSDFSLPDYQPEIKRLLRVAASMLPSSKYFGAGEAEFAGNIDYYVLYMGSDNEVYCAPLTGEYSVSIPIEKDEYIDLGDELISVVQTVPDMISGRVTSPRHITIKCRLKTHAKIYGKGKAIKSFRKCDGSVEKLKGETQNAELYFGAGEMLSLTDEVIPDSRDGEFRVVCADGKVMVNEVGAGKGEVICRGELHMKLLMSRENGTVPTTMNRRIPFSSIIPCEGVTPDSSVYAKGTLAELTLTVDEGRVLTEAGIILETVAQENRQVEYVSDIYSTTNKSECEYRNISVPIGVSAFNKNFTLSESMTLSDAGVGEGVSVADICGNAFIDEYKFEGGKCKMIGRCKFNLQTYEGGDYSNGEIELPFKYEYDMPSSAQDKSCECQAEAKVVFCRARVDGERIGIDAEVALCGRVWEQKDITVLESYRMGEALDKSRGEITVCYPRTGDSLWSVAKRYNAPIVSLIENNKLQKGISPDSISSLEGVEYLVV